MSDPCLGRMAAPRAQPQSLLLLLLYRGCMRTAAATAHCSRFVLVSSSGVPLYDPLTLYQRLMAVEKSHVADCYGSYQYAAPIWTPAMETPLLKKEHVRKSSQWFSLIRKHAELAVADREVYEAFKHCACSKAGTPDEFYMATLLKAHDEVGNTHCFTPTWVQWPWPPAAHPKSFRAAEVTPQLMHTMRGRCDNASDFAASHRMFSPLAGLLAGGSSHGAACQRLQGEGPANATLVPPINPLCHVMGRKFPVTSMAAVATLFVDTCRPGGASSEGGLGLLVGGACQLAQEVGLLPAEALLGTGSGGG